MNEREDKRMVSLARISKWPNTIHAERERKEYERIKKLEDDEVSCHFFSYFIRYNRSKEGKLMPKRSLTNNL